MDNIRCTRFEFGRCERIRTSDPFVPNEVRYQAAPHTEYLRPMTIPKAGGGTNIPRQLFGHGVCG